jgi:hypothetical protein
MFCGNFGILCCNFGIFSPRFGTLDQEKSGNPDWNTLHSRFFPTQKISSAHFFFISLTELELFFSFPIEKKKLSLDEMFDENFDQRFHPKRLHTK